MKAFLDRHVWPFSMLWQRHVKRLRDEVDAHVDIALDRFRFNRLLGYYDANTERQLRRNYLTGLSIHGWCLREDHQP